MMNQSAEQKIVESFREHMARSDLDGIHIVNQISGGMPGEGHIEKEFYVSGRNQARVRAMATGAPPEEAVSELSDAEVKVLFEQVGKGIDSLVPRSRARFIPDSVVGSITIDVDGEQATFFYLADEEQRKDQGQTMAPEMSEALEYLSKLPSQLREKREE